VAIQDASISARVESLRDEIRLILNQERFYRTVKHRSFERVTVHARRELRVVSIHGTAKAAKTGNMGWRSGALPEAVMTARTSGRIQVKSKEIKMAQKVIDVVGTSKESFAKAAENAVAEAAKTV
jgi:Dodecin